MTKKQIDGILRYANLLSLKRAYYLKNNNDLEATKVLEKIDGMKEVLFILGYSLFFSHERDKGQYFNQIVEYQKMDLWEFKTQIK